MNRWRSGIAGGLALTAAIMAGCASLRAEGTYGAQTSPYLRVESEVGKNRRGAPVITGYVYNDYGLRADRIQLLVEGIGDRGQVVTRRTVPMLGSVPQLNRTYFEVEAPGAAANYRVSIYSFEWIAAGGA